MYAASATLKSSLDRIHHRSTRRNAPSYRGSSYRHLLPINPGSERERRITSGLLVIREEPAALRRVSPECDSTRCFADCRFEPAESAPGNSPSRKLNYYLRLFCIRAVLVFGTSGS